MNTKNIFKAMALAMLMPAMLLTTACSSDDSFINNEQTIKKGFELPVTINVTRQGDDATTRATYNGTTKKLEFSTGDQLFVSGNDASVGGAGSFAGTLDWVSDGTFRGTLTLENTSYTGTADDLLTAASSGGSNDVSATLLPAGYGNYLSIANSGYNAFVNPDASKAFATSKDVAIAQLSYEYANSYTSGTGFTLAPKNAILNFTIAGLAVSTEVTATLNEGSTSFVSGNVTTNSSGIATFAMGLSGGKYDLSDFTLTVGGKTITFGSHALVAGHIYNISRSALTYPIALGAATSDYVGSVVTTDGNVYATVAAASAASKTAVAIIAYVGTAGSVDASDASYKGLAIALSDANSGSGCQWAGSNGTCVSQTDNFSTALGFKNGITCTSTLTSDGHTHAAATAAANNNGTDAPTGASGWFMPSMGQWNLIVQGLASKKAGTAITTDLAESVGNDTYKADNLNSVITDAGGTGLKADSYWTSTEEVASSAWVMHFWWGYGTWFGKTTNRYVRSVIAF